MATPTPEEALLELEARGALPPERQAAVDELRTRGLLMSKEEYEVRSGTNKPDYMGDGILLPASFRRFTDRAMDPFGVKDEIMGGTQFVREFVKSGGDLEKGKAAYAKARDRDRAEQKVAHEDYGILPDIAGAFAAGGVLKPAISAAKTLTGRVARTSGAGTVYGAGAGAGHGEGGVTERAVGALKGGAIGAVAAPIIGHVALPALARTASGVAAAVRYGNKAVRGARDPEGHAIQNFADRLVAAGVDPAAMRARALADANGKPLLSKALGKKGITEEQLADIVGRARNGEAHATIAADYGIGEKTVGKYAKRYMEANPTPMNPIDLASEMVGDGRAMPLKRFGRAALSLADDESASIASSRLLDRQANQPGRTGSIIQESVGKGDFEATRTAGIKALGEEADTAYRGFYKEPDLATNALDDLMADPIFAAASRQAQQQARVAAIKRNQATSRRNEELRAQGKQEEPLEAVPFESRNDPEIVMLKSQVQETQDALRTARRRHQDSKDATEKRAIREEIRDHEDTITMMQRQMDDLANRPPEVFSPELLDLTQRQLRLKAEGKLADPNAARHAGDLREVLLDRMQDHYPTFKDIRRNYATGMGEFGEEGALAAGRELSNKLGAKTSEALRDYATFTPAQQELFRLGFARKMMDMAANPVEGAAIANQFSSQAVREIVEALYPKGTPLWPQGQRLLRQLRGEKTTTDNKNFLMSGSQTAEKSSDMGRMMEPMQAAADVAMGRWGSLVQNAATRLTTQLGQQGAGAAIRMLTEMQPAQLLPLMNRLTAAARNTQARRLQVQTLRQMRGRGFERLGTGTAIATGQQSAIAPPAR